MPADPRRCKSLIGRLAGLPGFPREYPTAITALIEILVTRAENDSHADLIIASILDGAERCPVVSDIIRVAHSTREAFRPPAHLGCEQCCDGWRQAWYLTDKTSGRRWTHQRITEAQANALRPQLDERKQTITEAVERCSCAGGAAPRMQPSIAAPAEQVERRSS